MHRYFDLITLEIYYAYFYLITQGGLDEMTYRIQHQGNLFCFKSNDKSIVSIEKKGIIFLNSNFLVEITGRICELIERDISLFKSESELYQHYYNCVLFALDRVQNHEFLKNFNEKYTKNE